MPVLIRTVAPPHDDDGVVTVETAKSHLNIVATLQDSIIQQYIDAAVGLIDGADGWLGRALLTQTWKLILDGWPPYWRQNGGAPGNDFITIPLPPLQAVGSIKYYDANDVLQTMNAGDYQVMAGEPARIYLKRDKAWPALSDRQGPVEITFTAGYEEGKVPAAIIQWLLLVVGDYYQNRETQVLGTIVAQLPYTDSMLTNLRIVGALYAGGQT